LEVVQQQQRASLGYAAAVREEEDEYQEYPWANAGLEEQGRGVQWVFLGCPGVGKGTYASRLAKLLQVPHIAMGDLVRQELSYATPIAKQVCLSLWFFFFFFFCSSFPDLRIGGLKRLEREEDEQNSQSVSPFLFSHSSL
jgi:hypothetical protein